MTNTPASELTERNRKKRDKSSLLSLGSNKYNQARFIAYASILDLTSAGEQLFIIKMEHCNEQNQ